MRPINNIVDITNYVMLELGQPLHAFDYDAVAAATDHRPPRPPGRAVSRRWTARSAPSIADMLVIADANGAVALAGVMGGADSEVTEGTTSILLESANFNAVSIRRTIDDLKMRSEASPRFDKGLSPELSDHRRASRHQAHRRAGRRQGRARHRRRLPRQAPETDASRCAGSASAGPGHRPASREVRASSPPSASAAAGAADRYHGRVPYWRTDVRIPDDVVEEVAASSATTSSRWPSCGAPSRRRSPSRCASFASASGTSWPRPACRR